MNLFLGSNYITTPAGLICLNYIINLIRLVPVKSVEIAEKPNYVLRANEVVYVPKYELLVPQKKVVWIITGPNILGFFIFQDNLFSELNWPLRTMLIELAILVSYAGGNKMVPSPF